METRLAYNYGCRKSNSALPPHSLIVQDHHCDEIESWVTYQDICSIREFHCHYDPKSGRVIDYYKTNYGLMKCRKAKGECKGNEWQTEYCCALL